MQFNKPRLAASRLWQPGQRSSILLYALLSMLFATEDNHFNIARSSTSSMTDHFSRAHQLLASGQLDQGIKLLHRSLQLALGHSHACVALGIACRKLGDL
jgi:hypothetical protein